MTKKMIGLILGLLLLCVSLAFAEYASELLTAENDWSESITIPRGDKINICITPNSNTALTVTLQCKYAEETSWGHEVDYWILTGASREKIHRTRTAEQEEYVHYRIGCATGDYNSGNATVRIGH